MQRRAGVGEPDGSVVVLAGGVGAARFLQGVVTVLPAERLTVISNVGDDTEINGLRVSPDIDIVVYTLAGVVNAAMGFGLLNDTHNVIEGLSRFGVEPWFRLGDRDLATCLYRTLELQAGRPLSAVTAHIARSYGLDLTLLPVTDDRLRTLVETPAGTLAFQEYFVRRRTADTVMGVTFDGAETAQPAPGVIEAIERASAILIAPSNPFVSIGPILAVRAVNDALIGTSAPVVAVSPIVGGEALKGPAAAMFRSLGGEASAVAVARHYAGLIDTLIIDGVDAALAEAIEAEGVDAAVTDTIMRGPREKANLARVVLETAQVSV